ncbi:SRPBCC family protein [Asanoa sp. WMMD1127]|uniref:SRPBCC family protein n=1 Tax=Asanoa sp. WMMD1127 TaxID=3016107 RepID=UPI002415EDFE|nr:SRPBCC family protein [Asanoa sp. WMMD1127]MDG4820455.1 SRPBCC family protein [Asanoa sp. WMMD1127]
MMLTTSTEARADLASTWAALRDVTDWPRWTRSMTSVERLDDGPLRLGSRARVKQPGMQPLVWEVTTFADEAEFSWTNHSPGVRTIGRHLISPTAGGGTTITLELAQTGPLAGLLGLLFGRRNRRYLAMEVAGLAAASEAAAGR